MKKVFFEDVEVGNEIPPLVKEPIDEVQLVKYAGASGDFNPLHTVHAFGEMAGFGGVIAHGMLSMGSVGQLLTDWVGPEALKKLKVRFSGVVKPGDVITCKGKILEKRTEEGKNLVDLAAVRCPGVICCQRHFCRAHIGLYSVKSCFSPKPYSFSGVAGDKSRATSGDCWRTISRRHRAGFIIGRGIVKTT